MSVAARWEQAGTGARSPATGARSRLSKMERTMHIGRQNHILRRDYLCVITIVSSDA